ncbi:MAG: hypothetical protein HY072_06920 [Deltaproteobacteria bacterium]|nr:hypothetical protein [Deltaproteobacteria bacterium]
MSATHSAWSYPDEWFQTVEFAQFLVSGSMSHTHEVGLHLRNLSWPLLLTLPLRISHWLSPDWIWLRVFSVQVFSGLLDFGILWGFFELYKQTEFSVLKKYEHAALSLLVLPSFFALASIKPSQEHIATVAFWVALGLLSKRHFFWAGVVSIGIGAFKYPAFLLTLGILLCECFRFLWHRSKPLNFGKFLIGLGVGVMVFGAADWFYYGRPWESLWMFLQYNVWSGLAAKNFGTQSAAIVYLDYFQSHWGGIFLPLTIIAVPFVLYGFIQGLHQLTPWALGGFLYALGHVLIAHKEPRFMIPLEVLCVWCAWVGWGSFLSGPSGPSWITKTSVFVIKLIFVVNIVFLLRVIWGETWVANGTYFEVNRHLKQFPDVCAVVTVKRPLSIYIPRTSPNLAFGFFVPQIVKKPLLWIEKAPNKKCNTSFLLHLHKPNISWENEGCTLLASGFLSILPRNLWPWALSHKFVSGSWYNCPVRVLSLFKTQETRMVLAHAIPPIVKLPSFRAIQEEISGVGDGSFSDIP